MNTPKSNAKWWDLTKIKKIIQQKTCSFNNITAFSNMCIIMSSVLFKTSAEKCQMNHAIP